MPRAHNSININEKDIEPSQMVFQGDARNELGPSPRGAIYRKHQKTTSVETSFHKKFGTELPRLEYCRKRKLATTPKPQTSGPRESTKNIYKNQAARPLKNRAAGTAVHSLPSSAEAWHVHSHPKTISRLRRSVRRIRENQRDAHAYANPRTR